MSGAAICSAGSLAVDEPLAGSSPEAVAWVAVEQSGPWGPRAFTGSHLDPDLGRALEAVASEHQVRPVLVRRPGRHADPHPSPASRTGDPRQLLVAATSPGRSWLLEGTVDRPETVLELDWSALQAGDREAVRRSLPALRPTESAHLLVCTNGTRDRCCALLGRPVALAAAALAPGRVWEVTHTSGHRFAPTAVLLPAGTLHGRLDGTAAAAVLAAHDRGETVLDGSRGRSTWPAHAQVAELAVRELTGELGLDSLDVASHEQRAERAWLTEVRHVDGRRWQVRTEARPSDVRRAESCAKALSPLTYLTAVKAWDSPT